MNLGVYGKTITALVTGVIGWCAEVASLPGGFTHITAALWVQLATVVAIAIGVYSVANAPTVTELPMAQLKSAGPMTVRLHPDDIALLKARAAVKKR